MTGSNFSSLRKGWKYPAPFMRCESYKKAGGRHSPASEKHNCKPMLKPSAMDGGVLKKLLNGDSLGTAGDTHKFTISCPCFVSASETHSKARRQAGVGDTIPTKKLHRLDLMKNSHLPSSHTIPHRNFLSRRSIFLQGNGTHCHTRQDQGLERILGRHHHTHHVIITPWIHVHHSPPEFFQVIQTSCHG